MYTYETYETNEDREKELSDAKHKGYTEGRNKALQEWNLSKTRWERFRNAVVALLTVIALWALIFLAIVPAIQSYNEWSESLRVWKADCIGKGGIVVDPAKAGSNQTGKYLCVIGRIESTK